jgi:protein phosphatase
MDKIAIISDIHGNIPALKAVISDIKRRRIKKIFCLGDLVGKGPNPAEAIDMVRAACEVVIQGNWDLGITYKQEKASGLWQQQQLDDDRISYLEKLPFSVDLRISGKLLRLFHASSTSVFHRVKRKATKEERLKLFENTAETGISAELPRPDLVGYGDIHVPYLLTLRNPWDKSSANPLGTGKTLFNVGSVGTPYDGVPQACYCILEGSLDSEAPAVSSIQMIRVPYDIESAVQLAIDANMPDVDRYVLEIRSGLVHK